MDTALPTATSCPLCGGNCTKKTASEPGLTINRCGNCSMTFATPYCSQFTDKCLRCANKCLKADAAAPQYYADLFPGIRLLLEKSRLERIKKAAGGRLKGRKVLELGSGVGALARLLADEGAVYEGLEPMEMFYKKSVEYFPELAGNIKNCFVEGLKAPEGGWDIIIAADVLEYIANPTDFLRSLRKMLAGDGFLYLEVPNEVFFFVRTAVRARLELYNSLAHPGHVNFFSPATLKRTVREAGLRPFCRQISILSDPARLKATLKKEPPLWLSLASLLARWTKFDLALQQGNLVCVCVNHHA